MRSAQTWALLQLYGAFACSWHAIEKAQGSVYPTNSTGDGVGTGSHIGNLSQYAFHLPLAPVAVHH